MLSQDEAKTICEKLLKLTRADDASVRVTETIGSNQRFAANAFTTNGSSRERAFSVSVWIDKKQGNARGTDFNDATLRRVVEEAEQIAKVSPVDVEYMPTLGRQEYKPVHAYSNEAASLSPKWRAEQIGEILDHCEKAKVTGAGFFRSGTNVESSATRHGNFLFEQSSNVSLAMTARTLDGTSSGFGLQSHFDPSKLNLKLVRERAIEKAINGGDAKTIEPGVYPVILEPLAVRDILGFFTGAFNARAAEEGRGALSAAGGTTNLGKRIFDEKVNFYSDPWHPEVPGSPATNEGLPARKMHLIREGVVENLIYNRFWAAKSGKEPTPGPVNSVLESAGKTHSVSEMIAASDRALLLTRFWYIRMVNPRTQLLTGLTRDGVWLVENGKIKHPVRNFRFNQSVLQMLGPGNVEMIGKSERAGGAGGDRGYASFFPALKLKVFTFSSASEAV